jgi:hypothetical protein
LTIKYYFWSTLADKMTSLPIIFFHSGNPAYLKYSLKQAKHFNPDATIYLLGDKTNNRYPFVKHINIKSLQSDAGAFSSIYKHRSPNDENYELNCFLRWFYIKAFCRQNGIEGFIYLDSDVLMFQNFNELKPFFGDKAIANTCDWTGMPAVSYFKDYQAIYNFCDFLIHAYKDTTAIKKLEEWYDTLLVDPVTLGGISDMVLFHFYFLEHPNETIKIDLINNELAIDISINREDGYEQDNGIKKIYWQDDLPYCKNLATGNLVRFASLHYQGDAKSVMREHYKGDGYKLQRLWEHYQLKSKIKKIKQTVKQLFKK